MLTTLRGSKSLRYSQITWNLYAISSVALVWLDDIIEQRAVTKERQVPYDVPVQVEKQRSVMQAEKVPFWEAIFRK